MKFHRQARIFRGHLDLAPAATVLFMLLFFLQHSSLLNTPGVLIQLKGAGPISNPASTIAVKADGRVVFGANSFTNQDLEPLRMALKSSTAGPPFYLATDADAPVKRVEQVRDLVEIALPAGSIGLGGTDNDNATVVVAVNFLGQYMYDNNIVDEQELKSQLKQSLRTAASASRDLTLVVWADKDVNFDAVNRLDKWAREIGVQEVLHTQRDVITPTPSAASTP